MSSGTDSPTFVRHPPRHGAQWLRDASAMLSAARMPWLVMLLAYYLIQIVLGLVPIAGPLALIVLRPVFTVGFLAAAWSQERGGTLDSHTFSAAFNRTCGRSSPSASSCLPVRRSRCS